MYLPCVQCGGYSCTCYDTDEEYIKALQEQKEWEMAKQKKLIKDDPKVKAMAECMLFALENFKPTVVMHGDGKCENWHHWYKRTLEETGYVFIEKDNEVK